MTFHCILKLAVKLLPGPLLVTTLHCGRPPDPLYAFAVAKPELNVLTCIWNWQPKLPL